MFGIHLVGLLQAMCHFCHPANSARLLERKADITTTGYVCHALSLQYDSFVIVKFLVLLLGTKTVVSSVQR